MNCKECQYSTKLYLDNQLPLSDFYVYREHLEVCPSCKEDLYITYALTTALKQLNEGEDLSTDYVREVENQLNMTGNSIRRGVRRRIFRRIFICLELLGITFLFCFFSPEEKGYAYRPDDAESYIRIEYNGVPNYMDPVRKAIYRYNDELVDMILERDRMKGENP